MTAGALDLLVEKELQWREKEMALAKIQLFRAIGNKPRFRYSYRCFIAITYAHVEGFAKKLLAQTLDEILTLEVLQSACNERIKLNLFVPYVRKSIASLSNAEFLNKVLRASDILANVPFPRPDRFPDLSNFSFNNFASAISCIGLDPADFSQYKTKLNHLTYARHECAHGDEILSEPTRSDRELAEAADEMQQQAVYLMHHLAVAILEHFQRRQYLESTE